MKLPKPNKYPSKIALEIRKAQKANLELILQRRKAHFAYMAYDEADMSEAGIDWLLSDAEQFPELAKKALDNNKDEFDGRTIGRLKNCINGIHKAWKALMKFDGK